MQWEIKQMKELEYPFDADWIGFGIQDTCLLTRSITSLAGQSTDPLQSTHPVQEIKRAEGVAGQYPPWASSRARSLVT